MGTALSLQRYPTPIFKDSNRHGEPARGILRCRLAPAARICNPNFGPSDMVRHYLIQGRVQGVGFRWFVHQEAAGLGLRGWVRNTEDGHVEVVAAGEAD